MSPLHSATNKLKADVVGGTIPGKDNKLETFILDLAPFHQGTVHGLHTGDGRSSILEGTMYPGNAPRRVGVGRCGHLQTSGGGGNDYRLPHGMQYLANDDGLRATSAQPMARGQ